MAKSDGTTDFRVYSSDDLRTWTDEGVMFDLRTGLFVGRQQRMGSCIIERKYVGKTRQTSYKYFYYFVAGENRRGCGRPSDGPVPRCAGAAHS